MKFLLSLLPSLCIALFNPSRHGHRNRIHDLNVLALKDYVGRHPNALPDTESPPSIKRPRQWDDDNNPEFAMYKATKEWSALKKANAHSTAGKETGTSEGGIWPDLFSKWFQPPTPGEMGAYTGDQVRPPGAFGGDVEEGTEAYAQIAGAGDGADGEDREEVTEIETEAAREKQALPRNQVHQKDAHQK